MTFKILLVSNFYPPAAIGGAEIVAHRQAKSMVARGNSVVVLTGVTGENGRKIGSLSLDEVDAIPVYRLVLKSNDSNENFHWDHARNCMISIINSHDIKIVHFHNVTGLGANLISMAHAMGLRTVVTLHDHWGVCFKNTRLLNNGDLCKDTNDCASCQRSIQTEGTDLPIRLRRDYVASCLERAGVLLSPSQYLAESYHEFLGDNRKVQVVSNGIDLDHIKAIPKTSSERVRFLCLSYLGEHKGIPLLLEAARRLVRDEALENKWELTIVGKGHLHDWVKRTIAANQLGDTVHLLGHVEHDDVIAMLPHVDVLVLASIWPENQPVSLLEAIASGTAQLASRIGGNVELVEDGVTGYLFEPGNVNDLVRKMACFINNRSLTSVFGENNRKRRFAFDHNRTIDQIESIYVHANSQPDVKSRIFLCAGSSPQEAVFIALERLHVLDDESKRISGRSHFIWHAWADAEQWKTASALWVWSDSVDTTLILRALSNGLPIIAAKNSKAHRIAPQSTVTYENGLDSLAILAALSNSPDLGVAIGSQGPKTARFLASIMPRPAFDLPIERLP